MIKRLPYDIIADTLLTVCCALASVCAVPTAYDAPFILSMLLFVILPRSFLICFAFHKAQKAWPVCAVSVVTILILGFIRRGLIINGAKLVWYSSVKLLSLDFSFLPTPSDPGEILDPSICVNEFLIVCASIIAVITALLLIRCRFRVPSLLVPVPAFVPALIYTDCPPAFFTVVLLLIYWAGVLFGKETAAAKGKNIGRGKAAFIILLTCLSLLLPFVIPETRFEPIPFSERRGIIDMFGSVRGSLMSRGLTVQKEFDLASEGEHNSDESKAFSVCSSKAGILTLRMHSYGLYAGSVWRPAREYSGEWHSMLALGQTQAGEDEYLRIREAYFSEQLTPYAFLARYDAAPGESFIRANGRTAYVWSYASSDGQLNKAAETSEENSYYKFALDQYTLPEGPVRKKLLKLLEDMLGSADNVKQLRELDNYSAALRVASIVRASGEYSLAPGETPADEDFVEYFLVQRRKGYCVHYASATTALLQAIGVPARYVIGYKFAVYQAEAWTDIPFKASHSWTEVYVKGVGWLPVESTPGYESDEYCLTDLNGGGSGYGNSEPDPSEQAPSGTPRPGRTPRATHKPKPELTLPPLPTAAPGGASAQQKTHFDPLWLLVIPAVLLVWQAVGAVIRRRRRRSFEEADANSAVLAMLKYLGQLEKYGAPKVNNAEKLANEAAFSNHPMDEKRGELLALVHKNQKDLCLNKPLKRFALRWLTFRI